MTHTELIRQLSDLGITCQEHPNFDAMMDVSGVLGRVECAQDMGDRLGGLSFWLHGSGERWYLGLWTPRLYRLSAANVVPLVREIYSGKWLPLGKPPSALPEGLIQKFGLQEVVEPG